MSKSFCGTATTPPEGVLSWGLGGTGVIEHTKPLPAELVENIDEFQKRKDFFKFVIQFSFTAAGRHGGCFSVRDEEGKMGCHAITFPPNNRELHKQGSCEMMWIMNQLGGMSKLHPAFNEGEAAIRLDVMDKTMQAGHDKYAQKPHIYVWCLGSSPEQQGKGHGRTLLQHITAAADRMKVPTYLETSGEKNERFYTRNGFKVLERLPMTYVSESKTKEYGEKTEVTFRPDGLEGMSACVRPYERPD